MANKSVRIERSRDAPRSSAAPMGVSTSGECLKFILSACKAVEGLDTNGLGKLNGRPTSKVIA